MNQSSDNHPIDKVYSLLPNYGGGGGRPSSNRKSSNATPDVFPRLEYVLPEFPNSNSTSVPYECTNYQRPQSCPSNNDQIQTISSPKLSTETPKSRKRSSSNKRSKQRERHNTKPQPDELVTSVMANTQPNIELLSSPQPTTTTVLKEQQLLVSYEKQKYGWKYLILQKFSIMTHFLHRRKKHSTKSVHSTISEENLFHASTKIDHKRSQSFHLLDANARRDKYNEIMNGKTEENATKATNNSSNGGRNKVSDTSNSSAGSIDAHAGSPITIMTSVCNNIYPNVPKSTSVQPQTTTELSEKTQKYKKEGLHARFNNEQEASNTQRSTTNQSKPSYANIPQTNHNSYPNIEPSCSPTQISSYPQGWWPPHHPAYSPPPMLPPRRHISSPLTCPPPPLLMHCCPAPYYQMPPSPCTFYHHHQPPCCCYFSSIYSQPHHPFLLYNNLPPPPQPQMPQLCHNCQMKTPSPSLPHKYPPPPAPTQPPHKPPTRSSSSSKCTSGGARGGGISPPTTTTTNIPPPPPPPPSSLYSGVGGRSGKELPIHNTQDTTKVQHTHTKHKHKRRSHSHHHHHHKSHHHHEKSQKICKTCHGRTSTKNTQPNESTIDQQQQQQSIIAQQNNILYSNFNNAPFNPTNQNNNHQSNINVWEDEFGIQLQRPQTNPIVLESRLDKSEFDDVTITNRNQLNSGNGKSGQKSHSHHSSHHHHRHHRISKTPDTYHRHNSPPHTHPHEMHSCYKERQTRSAMDSKLTPQKSSSSSYNNNNHPHSHHSHHHHHHHHRRKSYKHTNVSDTAPQKCSRENGAKDNSQNDEDERDKEDVDIDTRKLSHYQNTSQIYNNNNNNNNNFGPTGDSSFVSVSQYNSNFQATNNTQNNNNCSNNNNYNNKGNNNIFYSSIDNSDFNEPTRKAFQENMLSLKKVGWYWGPLSFTEAERLMENRANGTFLIRDSGHDTYFLSLTFRVRETTYHTRIEYSQGTFSFWSQPESHSATTISEFIDKAVAHSQSGKFHYFLLTNVPGQPPMEVSLLYPLSRNQIVHPLKHLARFVILNNIRKDHISLLSIPPCLRSYLLEKQCYVSNLDQFIRLTKDAHPLSYGISD